MILVGSTIDENVMNELDPEQRNRVDGDDASSTSSTPFYEFKILILQQEMLSIPPIC